MRLSKLFNLFLIIRRLSVSWVHHSTTLSIACFLVLSISCHTGSNESITSSTRPQPVPIPPISGDNVVELTVNGSTCKDRSPLRYINKPCVAVTICALPAGNTSNCTTVSDILLDTGSYGLRVFKSALSSSLASALSPISLGSGNSLAECVQFGDGSKEWGPVVNANVILAQEPAVTVPIQLIDPSFSGIPSICVGAETGPDSAGINGILGVGSLKYDCGNTCVTSINNNRYFSCNGATCTVSTASLTNQVQSVISALPRDNNGVIVVLPQIPLGGAASANGHLILGIGTSTNNLPTGNLTTLTLNSSGNITTNFGGNNYTTSYVDSGSNMLYFNGASFRSSLPDCGLFNNSYAGFFCPSSTISLSATTAASNGASKNVSFMVGNYIDLINTSSSIFGEIGADGLIGGVQVFGWGLPFFFGKNVFIGLENKASSLGTGPYWAF